MLELKIVKRKIKIISLKSIKHKNSFKGKKRNQMFSSSSNTEKNRNKNTIKAKVLQVTLI